MSKTNQRRKEEIKLDSKPVVHQNEKPHYEFGGPIGALGTMIALPLVSLGLQTSCTSSFCLDFHNLEAFFQQVKHIIETTEFFNLDSTLLFLSWMCFQVILERLLPFTYAEGVTLSTGKKLNYRISGLLQFWVSLAAVLFLHFVTPFKLSYVYEKLLQLAFSSILFSLALSVYLYLTSFAPKALLAKGGNTGNHIYDFFIGRELNPRIGDLDLKYFCELRPGLIGWAVLNLAMLLEQYNRYGFVSIPMILINIFQGIYVWDALNSEAAILTTMDITTDGFGFMLAFGDLAWVPFTYTLQAKYLVDHDPHLSQFSLLLITILFISGYYLFRASNGQKNDFRTDPTSPAVKHLSFMETKRGTKLLTSGFWGMARKINYTADMMMGLSWCLLCGFNHIVPYWYAVYIVGLLIHRALRDDHACRLKYGEDWVKYKKIVPYVFIPKVI